MKKENLVNAIAHNIFVDTVSRLTSAIGIMDSILEIKKMKNKDKIEFMESLNKLMRTDLKVVSMIMSQITKSNIDKDKLEEIYENENNLTFKDIADILEVDFDIEDDIDDLEKEIIKIIEKMIIEEK